MLSLLLLSKTLQQEGGARPAGPRADGSEPAARPRDYGALNAVYIAALAGLVAAQQRRDVEERINFAELLPLGAAAFSLSKAIAREKIGTWFREPFVDESARVPQPRGGPLRRALGELVTCTRCVGTWSSLGIVGLRLLHPPAGRAATSVFATAAVNDFLQGEFRALCDVANGREPKSQGAPSKT